MIEEVDSLFNLPHIQAQLDAVEKGLTKLQGVLVETFSAVKTNKVADMSGMVTATETLTKKVEETASATQNVSRVTDDYIKKVKEVITSNVKFGESYDRVSGSLDENIRQQLKYKMTLDALTKEQRLLKREMDLVGDSGGRLTEKMVLISTEIGKVKNANTELNRTIRLQIKENSSAAGSVDELKARYERLYQVWRGLSEQEQSMEIGVELNKELGIMSDRLNELQKSAGNFSGNVGRYAGSLAAPFETLQNLLKEIKADLEKGIGIGGTDEASLARANKAVQAIETSITKSSKETATSTQQVRNLANAWTTVTQVVSQAGDSTTLTSSVQKLGREIGQAKDEVKDLQDELKLNASDTKGLDNVVGSLNVLANVAQGAAGAYALLGASEEDAAKITSKLIAIQGIANSVREVGQELTKRGTVANQAYTFVQQLVATATDRTAASTARLNAVLKLSTIGLVVAAIGGLAYLLSKAGDATALLTGKQKGLIDTMEGSKDAFVKATVEVKNAQKAFQQAREGIIKKEEAVKLYNETIGKTTGQVKTLDEAEQALGRNAGDYIKFMQLKAQANVALGKAAEAAFNIQVLTQKRDELMMQFKGAGGTAMKAAVDNLKADMDKQIKEAEKDQQIFTKIQEEIDKQLDKTSKEKKFDRNDIVDPTKEPKKTTEKEKVDDSTNERILQSTFETNKIRLQSVIDTNLKISENENNSLEQRLTALRNFIAASISMIEDEKNHQITMEQAKLAKTIVNLKGNRVQIAKEVKATAAEIAKITTEATDKIERFGEEAHKKMSKLQGIDVGTGSSLEDRLKKSANAEIKITYDKFKLLTDMEKKFLADQAVRNADAGKALRDLQEQLFNQAKESIIAFVGFSFDKQKNRVESEMELLEERTKKEVDNASASGDSEERKAARIQTIQARAAVEKDSLERKKKKIDQDRARFEKAANAAQIIGETAVAVIAALRTYKGTPFAFGIAATIAAIGALQLATVLAAPIPKYKGGRGTGKEELAIVGDGGQKEYIKRGKTGRIEETPARDTLVHLMAEDVVFKDKHTMQKELAMGQPALSNYFVTREGNIDFSPVVTAMGEVKDAVAGIRIQTQMITKSGWKTVNKRNADYDAWVKRTITD